jgi:hypothetical protein
MLAAERLNRTESLSKVGLAGAVVYREWRYDYEEDKAFPG